MKTKYVRIFCLTIIMALFVASNCYAAASISEKSDNGQYVETYIDNINGQSAKKVIIVDETGRTELIYSANPIYDNVMDAFSYEETFGKMNRNNASDDYFPFSLFEEDYNNADAHPTLTTFAVGHWGTYIVPTLATIQIHNRGARGFYNYDTVPTKMALAETYKFTGLGVSVSWPPGISVGPSSNEGYWASLDYPNTRICTHYGENLEGSGLYLSFTIRTSATVYLGSTSYAHSVESIF